MRFIGKIIFMLSLTFFILLIVIFLDIKLHLGFSETDMEVFIFPLLTLLNFFIMFPNLRKNFYKQFLKTKELHLLIALPILLSLIQLLLIYIYMYIPVFYNNDPVSIGSNQYVTSENLTILGDFLLTSIVGPFNEEVIFRFLLLYYVPLIILRSLFIERQILNVTIQKFFYLLNKKNKVIISVWVILISSIFSLMHGPDLWSFIIYFPGGVICSYLFLRYGFISAWIAHASFNAISPFMHNVVIKLLSLFIQV